MRQILLVFCCAGLCLASLNGCVVTEASAPDPEPVAIDDLLFAPSQTPSPEEAADAGLDEEVDEEAGETSEPAVYWFGQPVEESEPVEDEWFRDAVFLGDSRTEGLQIYSGLRDGDFFWRRGMSVFQVNDPEKRFFEVNGLKMTMLEALGQTSYEKVYIMIGVNELGYPAASYGKGLRSMIDQVKVLQPEAVIYLQTLPPVNETLAAQNGLGSYINNTNVDAFNQVIVQVAWEKQVALLDVASVFRTEQGDLAEDMASDGVHFYREGYTLWYDYLKTHTLDPEVYASGQTPEEPPEYGTESEPEAAETENTAQAEEPSQGETAETQETEGNIT
jgi:hypothetical protein